MKKKNNQSSEIIIASAIIMLIGLLFMVLKNSIISYAVTILGVLLIVYGIINLVHHLTTIGIIKIVCGAVLIIFGWTFVLAITYIVAAMLMIYGIYRLITLIKNGVRGVRFITTILTYAVPIGEILIAVLLFINAGATLDWMFIVIGIIIFINGLTMMIRELVRD